MPHRYNVELETLDCLCYYRTKYPWQGPLGWGISLWTRSDKVHAGWVLKEDGRVLVCDATGDYVDVRPVSADLLHGRRIKVLRMPNLTIPDPHALTRFAHESWGVMKYGYAKFFLNAFAEIFGQPWSTDPKKAPKRVVCSEFVSLTLRKYGRIPVNGGSEMAADPCPHFADTFTTPRDLDKKSRLVTVTDMLTIAAQF